MRRVHTSFIAVSTFFLALPAFAQDGSVVRQQRFSQRDADRDGFLTQGEYGGHPGNFRALDRDSDNRLSRDEFVRRGGDVVRELPDAFADLDLNADTTLSRSEWYGQAPDFDRVDRDNDGRIRAEEFRNLPAADDRQEQFYGRDTNSDGVLSRREWQEQGVAFHRVDVNDDGAVSLREFLAVPQTQTGDDREARFDGFDRDGDGTLTRSEWRDAPAFTQADRNRNNQVTLWEFTNSSATDPTQLSFDEMDRNNDGMLSRREWHAEPGAFAAADRNDDGLVTLREFLNGAADDQGQRFRTMDRNRDGFVTRGEWAGSANAFTLRDRNRDGRVSRTEYTS
jgi:Ca2+-binding EF-hand superfamily protein